MTAEAEDAVRNLLELFVPDCDRPGLEETPARVAKAYANEWLSGYSVEPFSFLKTFDDGAENADQMIVQTNIPIWSLCEHHMAPFFGVAHVAYLPQSRIVGLSKLTRVVNGYARRLQVQERLTNEIAQCLYKGLVCKGVGVLLKCRHTCMESRGVRTQGTETTTSALLGVFRDAAVRSEFFSLAHRA